MRPKIKDFAEHCDFYVGNEHYDKSYEEKQVLWLEKFADMIVQECSDAVLSVPCYYKDYRSQIEEAVINDCGRAVLEHFGVTNGECKTGE